MNIIPLKYLICEEINNILSENPRQKYAELSQIYEKVSKRLSKNEDYSIESQIRALLQEHCSQYKNYLGEEDLFRTHEINSGKWKNKTTGESELKPYVLTIIRAIPGIDVTNLQTFLIQLFKDRLTYADKMESITRPGEMKIEQIIRNFVSHKDTYSSLIEFRDENGKTKLYIKDNILSDEFIELEEFVDNQIEENLLNNVENDEILLNGNNEVVLTFCNDEIVEKKKRKRSNKLYIRKRDYIKENSVKLENGYMAEQLVYNAEKERLISLHHEDLANKIRWISREDGDGAGYDILSYDIINGVPKEIFIEVKSTTGELNEDFDISKRELDFAREKGESYKIYRVARSNTSSPICHIFETFIDEQFNFEPVSYKAIIKN